MDVEIKRGFGHYDNDRETAVYGLLRNNKMFYIGITTDPKLRIKQHKKTYGQDVEPIMIDIIKGTLGTALEWEQYYIWLFRSYGFTLDSQPYELLRGYRKNRNRKVGI